MGVGGNDSWSDVAAPLSQYQVKARPCHYSFYIIPFNSKNKKVTELVNQIRY
jgi:beta-galactosidase